MDVEPTRESYSKYTDSDKSFHMMRNKKPT